jgi:hypothetical protein
VTRLSPDVILAAGLFTIHCGSWAWSPICCLDAVSSRLCFMYLLILWVQFEPIVNFMLQFNLSCSLNAVKSW